MDSNIYKIMKENKCERINMIFYFLSEIIVYQFYFDTSKYELYNLEISISMMLLYDDMLKIF